MKRRNNLVLVSVLLLATAFPWGINTADAGPGITNPCPPDQICPEGPGFGTYYANSPAGIRTYQGVSYFTGGPLRKFVDSLPGLGYANRNNLGQYIPVAVPDTSTFPGSDYYVIGLKDYRIKMHSDMPAATDTLGTGTRIRGYYQINGTDHSSQYLGPLIIARRDRPVRLLFENHLGAGTAGDLFIPVDTTVMGAGQGPLGLGCGGVYPGCNYTQNRAVIHLHGGNTPWISDGIPRQWITPIGEYSTPYLKGETQRNVPDMWFDSGHNVVPAGTSGATNDPGQGRATYYWTNQQSGRFMFFHDHSYGLTRLNVYAGEAAGYLITDPEEDKLIDAGTIPNVCPSGSPDCVYRYGIPLVIEDKTFVPWDVSVQDAKWDVNKWGKPGDLWFPHVYEPNQKPNDPTGANPFGRWDYGPWFWPPVLLDAAHSTLPDPSIVPEAFMDTPIVNGTAYPYLNVEPKAYRFRILNATNDRMLNLQFYVAEPLHISVTNGGSNYSATPIVEIGSSGCTPEPLATATVDGGVITGITVTNSDSIACTSIPNVSITDSTGTGAAVAASINTEVRMVAALPPTAGNLPACTTATVTNDSGLALGGLTLGPTGLPANCWPTTWPVDGRDGGVPDPTTAGPAMVQIGTEGGFLPKPVVIPSTPVGYEYNRRNIVVLNVLNKAIFLGSAERADIVVDFSQFAGKTLIMYNDAPAPVPGFDPRNDYYTDDPDQSSTGGAPTTLPGYGPNTRTIMQFRVADSATPPTFDLAALQNEATGLPAAFAASQPPMHVPEPVYPAPNNAVADTLATIQAYSLTFNPNTLTSGIEAIRNITVINGGAGYTVATVTVDPPPPGGTQATASAAVSGGAVTAINIINPGSGYYYAPGVTISGDGTGAAAVANFGATPQAIRSVTVTNGGSGCVASPTVNFLGGGGTGATASATAPAGEITGITVTNGGSGYTSLPAVAITGCTFAATAVANFEPVTVPMQPKAIQELWDSYGRMNATLGVELPFTNNNIQTTIPLGYIDPTTEIVPEGQTQLWKITHNGVDTHPVHVHLYNMQIINRVGWDGAIRPPEDNELGWKETVRMNPLEDIIVALQPRTMTLPFTVPDSVHSEDTTTPASSNITVVSPFGIPGGGVVGNPIIVSNADQFFGWEYVWHCHILGHEENDFMRPFVMLVPNDFPAAPTSPFATVPTPALPATTGNTVQLSWTDNDALDPQTNLPEAVRNSEIGFRIERDSGSGFVPITNVFTPITYVYPDTIYFTDTQVASGATYNYRIWAYNEKGDSLRSVTASVTMPTWTKADSVTLIPTPASPVVAGNPVLFSAYGSGSSVSYQYRFWQNGVMVQDYGIGSTWTMPASTLPGTYTIIVDVRTSLSSPAPDASASTNYVVSNPFVTPASGSVQIVTPPTTITPHSVVTPYSTLAAAFAAAQANDTIEAWGVPFSESINLTTPGPATVTFAGGYDQTFGSPLSMTTLQGGSLTVGGVGGTLVVDRLTIQ
ncbi:MAG: multicopper oxidase domain-containing protein [Nitrospiraceae bacterium]|nr:multicopper oxidase domain-containing protein [Nitrospiraceae bacterium]